jgi:hypothetical protein
MRQKSCDFSAHSLIWNRSCSNHDLLNDLRTEAQKPAVALHTPFGYLFLSVPPKNDVKIPDLRTVGSKPITEFSPNLLDQLRNLLLKQEWHRDYASEAGRKPLAFVGRFNINSPYEKVAADSFQAKKNRTGVQLTG